MTKAEMQEIIDRQQEELNRQRERIKNQNEAAKKKWETVSCRLPKGTKERIEKHGLTTNGLINTLILSELDRLDKICS